MKFNPNENPIEIKCQGADRLPLDAILEFQGNLKRLSPTNRDKLITSICRKGFIAPVFIWENEGDNKLLDGHQRLKTLIHMRQQGWDIPLIPVVYVEADSEADAREKLLHITSAYGEFDISELESWIGDLDSDLSESLRLVDQELELFVDGLSEGEEGEEDETYTAKIEAPIYEITGEKPELSQLVDTSKTDDLVKEIIETNIEDKELEAFLIHSAHRHKVFNYDKIAEFYAHSSLEVQNLMEKSALVIIDFEKAIENGYVQLSKNIEALRKEDSGE